MDTQHEQKLRELRMLIERGDYTVDSTRVADSIVQCVSALALAHEHAQAPAPIRHHRRRIRSGVRGAARRCHGMKTALVTAVR